MLSTYVNLGTRSPSSCGRPVQGSSTPSSTKYLLQVLYAIFENILVTATNDEIYAPDWLMLASAEPRRHQLAGDALPMYNFIFKNHTPGCRRILT